MSRSSASPKSNEVNREEFRKYLEHSGVIDALSNVLLSLYTECDRPDDPLTYMQNFFAQYSGRKAESSSDVESLKKELAEAKAQIKKLTKDKNVSKQNKENVS